MRKVPRLRGNGDAVFLNGITGAGWRRFAIREIGSEMGLQGRVLTYPGEGC